MDKASHRAVDSLWISYGQASCPQLTHNLPTAPKRPVAPLRVRFAPQNCPVIVAICNLAGCIAWEEFAAGDSRIEFHKGREEFTPGPGDIVLYDRVFENREHDHIGIIIEKHGNTIIAAEGNINNRSGIIERPVDEHIRAFIRVPDGYRY